MLNGGWFFSAGLLKTSEGLSADLIIQFSAAAVGLQLFSTTAVHGGGLWVYAH